MAIGITDSGKVHGFLMVGVYKTSFFCSSIKPVIGRYIGLCFATFAAVLT